MCFTMKVLVFLAVCVAAIWASPAPSKLGFPGLGKVSLFGPSPRVVNGQDAKIEDSPYQLSYQWCLIAGLLCQHVCGSSILTTTWVLTAGHCVTQTPSYGAYQVVAGTDNLNGGNPQTITITNRIVHPNYNDDVGPYDLAVAQLQSPLVLGGLVQPVPLPAPGAEPSGIALLTGWGTTGTSTSPVQLQGVSVPILPYAECKALIDELLAGQEANPLHEVSNVCTGGENGISACSGDSGGPLVANGVLVGAVSWGFTPCGQSNAPSVYTKVSSFIDFINQHVS